jgi:hypothetical protein
MVAQITLKPDEELSIKPKYLDTQPPYIKVGNGNTNKYGVKSMDLIKEMTTLSPSALKVIGWIKDGMTWDPIAESVNFVVEVSLKNSKDKLALKRGFKELHARDIVRRVKRGHYMINPNAIITDYNAQMAVWDAITEKNQQ